MALLLFDIDGTLVRTRPLHHQRALARGAVEVFGLPPTTDEDSIRAVEPWGKTDRQILRELLTSLGHHAPPADEEIDRWEREACRVYREIEDGAPDAADERTAGLLARLSASGHGLSLVTGNLEPIARHKLERRGLGRFFPRGQGGFGSDAESRAELVRLACARAGTRAAAEAVLIGDTPRDVDAALAAGVRPLAVAGGRYSADALLAAGAEAAVAELDELETLL